MVFLPKCLHKESFMKKYTVLLLWIILPSVISCSKDDNNNESKNISQINGFVEKGPFIAGSSVTVYELDANLNGTGKVFEAKTNDEGAFTINTSTAFVSNYVRLSVNGFYFNEYTGKLSDAPITLEGLTEIKKDGNVSININVLTHLETPRVVQLVTKEKLDFREAKKQAEEELLSAFLITGQAIVPEETSITANNTSANILIAVSSILLNQRSDAEVSELMSFIREDLSDGQFKEETIKKIEDSSFGLNYSNIKKHIIDRYAYLGKTVEVGNFELFIDGDGDGEIGDTYEEQFPVAEEDFFDKEENIIKFFQSSDDRLANYFRYESLFDGLYTQTVSADELQSNYDLRAAYEHNISSNSNLIYNLWASAYLSLSNDNQLLAKAETSQYDWFKKYSSFSRTYRSYKYLSMINLWGDVVLLTKQPNPDEAANIARTSKEKVLSFIISELAETEKVLPEEKEELFCDRYFAAALLARAYLEKKDYPNVLIYATKIINSGKYELSPDYNAIFEGGNKEVVFELPEKEEGTQIPAAYKGLIRKGNYIALSRYAEVLLMASEANYKQGNTGQAVSLLNQVRRRNGKTDLTAADNIEEALLEEWKEDLKNEGSYFATLKRLGVAENVLKIPDYKLLIPIPQREIDLNSRMTQNPGYN